MYSDGERADQTKCTPFWIRKQLLSFFFYCGAGLPSLRIATGGGKTQRDGDNTPRTITGTTRRQHDGESGGRAGPPTAARGGVGASDALPGVGMHAFWGGWAHSDWVLPAYTGIPLRGGFRSWARRSTDTLRGHSATGSHRGRGGESTSIKNRQCISSGAGASLAVQPRFTPRRMQHTAQNARISLSTPHTMHESLYPHRTRCTTLLYIYTAQNAPFFCSTAKSLRLGGSLPSCIRISANNSSRFLLKRYFLFSRLLSVSPVYPRGSLLSLPFIFDFSTEPAVNDTYPMGF